MYRFNRLFSSATSAAFRNHKSVDRKVLPPEISRKVVKLTCDSSAKGGRCDVYLVGTIHNYPKSVQDVRDVVKFVKPQVVFLELCSGRRKLLSKHYHIETEFRAAAEEANAYGAKVVLGDRLLKIGESRYTYKFARMPFWQIMKMGVEKKFKIAYFPSVDDFYEKSDTFLKEYVSLNGPIYKEIMVDERDQYMSVGLLKIACKHKSVVAVVGIGHLPGIQKYWQQPIEVKQLLSIPPEVDKCSYRLKVLVLDISLCVTRMVVVIIKSLTWLVV